MSSSVSPQHLKSSDLKTSPTTRSRSKVSAVGDKTASKRRHSPRENSQAKKNKPSTVSNGGTLKVAAKGTQKEQQVKITRYFTPTKESLASSMGQFLGITKRLEITPEFSSDDEDDDNLKNTSPKKKTSDMSEHHGSGEDKGKKASPSTNKMLQEKSSAEKSNKNGTYVEKPKNVGASPDKVPPPSDKNKDKPTKKKTTVVPHSSEHHMSSDDEEHVDADHTGEIKQSKKELNKDGEKMKNKDGEKMTNKDGEKMKNKDGEKMTNKDGEKMTNKDGEKTKNKDGEKTKNKDGEKTKNKDGEKTKNKDGEKMKNKDEEKMKNEDEEKMKNKDGKKMTGEKARLKPAAEDTAGHNRTTDSGSNSAHSSPGTEMREENDMEPGSDETESYSMEATYWDEDSELHGAYGRSSWEPTKDSSRSRKRQPWSSQTWSDRDTMEYLQGYPGKRDKDLRFDANYRFYANEAVSQPNGDKIQTIHEKWWGDYRLLEQHHGFIQWLFPIREGGMNYQAQELQLHEIKKITENPELKKRVLTSYRLMLDFYGMELADIRTGRVQRGHNWEPRFKHLNRSYHNYLRITRILKCLGELGYARFQGPLVHFLLNESLKERTLSNAADSCLKYWVCVIKDKEERDKECKYADMLQRNR